MLWAAECLDDRARVPQGILAKDVFDLNRNFEELAGESTRRAGQGNICSIPEAKGVGVSSKESHFFPFVSFWRFWVAPSYQRRAGAGNAKTVGVTAATPASRLQATFAM